MSTSIDCRDHNHAACIGDARDHAGVHVAICACFCHPPVEEMPPEVGERIRAGVMDEVRRLGGPSMQVHPGSRPVATGGWDPGAARVAESDGDLSYTEYAVILVLALLGAVLAVMFG